MFKRSFYYHPPALFGGGGTFGDSPFGGSTGAVDDDGLGGDETLTTSADGTTITYRLWCHCTVSSSRPHRHQHPHKEIRLR